MSEPMVRVNHLHKSYRMGKSDLHVLKGVSFSVAAGEFVSIVGASGSGKSTLLHLIGLLDRTDKGTIHIDGEDAVKISSARRNRMRCLDIGFVFQFYHLLPELSVLENVMLPAMVDKSLMKWLGGSKQCRQTAMELIDRMELTKRIKHRPKELSGGERQRVAIARALMNKPKVLLADEPTGNLDSKTGQQILNVLKEFNKNSGQTIIMVTHDQTIAAQTSRTVHLHDGRMDA